MEAESNRHILAALVLLLALALAPACKKCPESCDDGDNCTMDDCSEDTQFECRHRLAKPCVGNHICEGGEYGESSDCPDCADTDNCTLDTFDFGAQACKHDVIVPCCGNGVCEETEGLYTCIPDCREGMTKLVAGREYRVRQNEKYQFELRQISLSAIWDRSVVIDVMFDTQRIGLRIDQGSTGTGLGIDFRVDEIVYDLDPKARSARLRVSPNQPVAVMVERGSAEAPEITDLRLTPDPDGVRVSWNLDQDADGIVNWGPTTAYGMHLSDFAFTRSHDILIPVEPGSYFVAVRSCLNNRRGVCTEKKGVPLTVTESAQIDE